MNLHEPRLNGMGQNQATIVTLGRELRQNVLLGMRRGSRKVRADKKALSMRRLAGFFLVCAALWVSGCNEDAPKVHAARRVALLGDERIPLGRLPQVAIPVHYTIALKVDPTSDHFTGHTEIEVDFKQPRRALFLHGNGLNVSGVSVKLASGQSFAAHYDQVDASGVARLIFVDRVPKGRATLIFDYDAPYGPALHGLYKVVADGVPYVFTQFEETYARLAFPSFDEPGFKTPFDITVIAPAADKVVGNTAIVSASRTHKGLREYQLETTKPLPTYLVALAVGPLDIVNGSTLPSNQFRNHPLSFRAVTSRGNGRRVGYALSQAPRVIAALENYFGIGYPYPKLDIIAVPDFEAGAMENAGAVTFRERLLLLDQDASIDQKRASVGTEAHEFAHQWFGDLVTPVWWNDIWLNESFANWMGDKVSNAVAPELSFETDGVRSGFEVMDLDTLPSARVIRQPVNNTDDLGNAFDEITYDKGEAVLRMLESYAGTEAWQQGVHAYLTKFAYGNATAQDFIGTIAQETGHPELVSAFTDFITQSNVPNIQVGGYCEADALDLSQAPYAAFGATPARTSWHLPVCTSQNGQQSCRLMTSAKMSVPASKDCHEPLLINPSGVGYFRYSLDEPGWQTQIASLPALAPADQIAVLDNIDAAMRSGGASPADLLAVVKTLASTARWDVLESIRTAMHDLRMGLSPSDLVAYRAFISHNFAARLSAAGLVGIKDEAPDAAQAREGVARLLVSEAHDAYAIAELSAAVRQNKPLAPELRQEAYRAALLADPAYGGELMTMFKAPDSSEQLRHQIVYAFAGQGDPKVSETLLKLALTPTMRAGEIRYLYSDYGADTSARTVLWPWLETNFRVLENRQTLATMQGATTIMENACDAGLRTRMDKFLAPYIAQIEGGARRLAETDEKIDRCVAFRAAKGADVSAALAAAAAR
ncbi:MAG TPA: M1 family metallopeptidase [Rhizomicrobium sp.]|nr:M1 family metallopeptidase [Rhizomicrobium sp.]